MKNITLLIGLLVSSAPAVAHQSADCTQALDAVTDKLLNRAQECIKRMDYRCADSLTGAALEINNTSVRAIELKKKIETEIKRLKNTISIGD
ncbi:MAG: hypothetical protein OEZ39_15640 [Gammaproteobacteria bacterium]|nr:hypothetical protein [Gammaproteobacteria bacterium]MDH5653289.1 hypothetical protein [Gammaproteobacteria bacterium]